MTREGKSHWLGSSLFRWYGAVQDQLARRLILRTVLRLEAGAYYSLTLRRIFSKYHYRDVGLYTAAGAFELQSFRSTPPGIKIGRYSSLSWSMNAFNADHPIDWRSTHAFFYNPILGIVKKDALQRSPLVIGNDVWIGHNAILLPTVSSIGDGAVIGAGAVVVQNVPAYAVVVGYPARVVRYRFSPPTIERLLASRWWDQPIDKLKDEIADFQKPIEQ